MSAIATGREARLPAPPSWLRVVGAVIGGTLLAWGALFVWLLPLDALDLVSVSATYPSAAGSGWPWRIDGAWGLAADLGPLLLSGAIFALGAEAFTRDWTGVRGRRLPVALAAAAVGWIPLNGQRQGLLAVSTLVAFVAVVIAVRVFSLQERRPWTRPKLALAAAAAVAFAAASVSYGVLHPLTGGGPDRAGRDEVVVFLRNEGRGPVRVFSVEVPGRRITRVRTDNEAVRVAPTVDGLMKPLAGSTIASDDSRSAYIQFAGGTCAPFDRVIVHLQVAGRTRRQIVQLEPGAGSPCG